MSVHELPTKAPVGLTVTSFVDKFVKAMGEKDMAVGVQMGVIVLLAEDGGVTVFREGGNMTALSELGLLDVAHARAIDRLSGRA